MAQTLGLITVIWNGVNIPVEEGGTVELGGLIQKSVVTGSTVDYAAKMEPSKVSVTGRIKRGDALLSLFGPGTAELQVQCDTGQSYIWPDAFVTSPIKFTGNAGGKLRLEWEAGVAQEILNG